MGEQIQHFCPYLIWRGVDNHASSRWGKSAALDHMGPYNFNQHCLPVQTLFFSGIFSLRASHGVPCYTGYQASACLCRSFAQWAGEK